MSDVVKNYLSSLKKRYSSYESFKKHAGKRDIVDVYPSINTNNGDFIEISGVEAIVRSVINILLTPKRTYPFDPEFGCDIFKFLFEPYDDITLKSIETSILEDIIKEENRCKINLRMDREIDLSKKSFNINVDIKYKEDKRSVKVPISEEYLKTIDNKNLGDV